MNPPDVAGFVERDAYHPPLASGAQRNTVGHVGGHTLADRKVVQGDCQSRLQRTGKPYTAALGVEHERVSGLGERGRRVQAGNAKRNLGADACAAPSRVNGLFGGVHNDENVLMILRS